MLIIYGLGNPEKRYLKSRHNLGQMVIDSFGIKLEKNEKFGVLMGRADIDNIKVILVKSLEYMNSSGVPISKVMGFFKLNPKDLIVVNDDVDIDFGKIQQKFGGSSAGHNGIKSIIKELGSNNFYRIRVGIGRPNNKNKNIETDSYVMADFSKTQIETLPKVIKMVKEVITKFDYKNKKKQFSIN